MAALSNDQLLVSDAGMVLDAGDIRIAPPPTGELAYSLESPEDVAVYGEQHGKPLELGDGTELESNDDLEDFMIIDINNGAAFKTRAGWKVIDHPGADAEVDLDDPVAAAKYAAEHSVGAPAAPADILSAQPPESDPVVVYD
jgi:hypothetical protein